MGRVEARVRTDSLPQAFFPESEKPTVIDIIPDRDKGLFALEMELNVKEKESSKGKRN